MDTKKDKENHSTQYNKDFYAWAMHNAALLKQKKFSEIDLPNVIEELESIGRNDMRELKNRLVSLIAYLLKWHYQPRKRSQHWRVMILDQRISLLDLLKDSPSLQYIIAEKEFIDLYERAVFYAQGETNLNNHIFPRTCPFTLKELLDEKNISDPK